ncbi:MAG: VanZ family protein, partial [Candidatus Riflebacteria bacterium]
QLNKHLQTVTAGWAVLILVLAFLPRWSVSPEIGLNHGMLAHFSAFGILAVQLFFLLTGNGAGLPGAAVGAWVGAGALGALVEFGQYLLPYRTYDPWDILHNAIAALIGIVFAVCIHFYQTTRNLG